MQNMFISTNVNFVKSILIDNIEFVLDTVQSEPECIFVRYIAKPLDLSTKSDDILKYLKVNHQLYNIFELIIGQVIQDKVIQIEEDDDGEYVVLSIYTMQPSKYTELLIEPGSKPHDIYNFKNMLDLCGYLHNVNIKVEKFGGHISRFFDTYISTIDIDLSKDDIPYIDGYVFPGIFEYLIKPNIILDCTLNMKLPNPTVELENHMFAKRCDTSLHLICVTIYSYINGIHIAEMSERYLSGFVDLEYIPDDTDNVLMSIIPYFFHNHTSIYYISKISKIITDGVIWPDNRRYFEAYFDTKILKLDDDKSIYEYIDNDTKVIYYQKLEDIKGYFCIYQSVKDDVDELYCGYYYNINDAIREFYNYIYKNFGSIDIRKKLITVYVSDMKTYFVLKK